MTTAMTKKASLETNEDKPSANKSEKHKPGKMVFDLEDTFLTRLTDQEENNSWKT